MSSEARLRGSLRRVVCGHDSRVLSRARHHGSVSVGIVGAIMLNLLLKGSGQAIRTSGGRLRAALGKVHAVGVVIHWLASVRRLRKGLLLLLGLLGLLRLGLRLLRANLVGRCRVVIPRCLHGTSVCVLHVRVVL